MTFRRVIHSVLFICVLSVGVFSFAGIAAAHNSLAASTPSDGASVDAAPTSVSLVFAKSVPLDTLSLQMIDSGGGRADLTTFSYGPAGDTEVIAALPPLAAGVVTFRWALVGADGHRLTGRFSFTVTASADAAQPTTIAPVPLTAAPNPDAAATSIPTPADGPEVAAPPSVEFAEPYVTGDVTRWLLRMVSYFAMIVIVGVMAAVMFVWSDIWGDTVLPRIVSHAHIVVGVLALIQLLVVASDIAGKAPWAAFDGLGGAFKTDAGRAFAFRLVLVALLWFVLFAARFADESQRWLFASIVAPLLLATWSFAGHSKSMRWALIGVPLDVAHFAAAGAWIGGLAVVGLVAVRFASTDDLVVIVPRFGRVAAVSVAILAVTGVLQTIRLEGSPFRVFEVAHGRWLVLKLVILAAMLWIADINRKRVGRRFASTERITARATHMLSRAMGTELTVGAAIMIITAIMVVSPPATANDTQSTSTASPTPATDTSLSLVPAETAAPVTVPASAPVIPPVDSIAGNADAGATTCGITTSLKLGSTGDDVLCLQQALAAAGVYSGPTTGTFDDTTDAAVRAFQSSNALLDDGIVGPVTARKLGIWAGS